MSKGPVPIKEFRLELNDLTYTGHDLVRPESVIVQPNRTLWASDGRGGMTRINADGSQQFIGGLNGNEVNGLAMGNDGSIFVANLGLGKVQRIDPDGRIRELLTEVDGVHITTPNFVFLDSKYRLWISVMTREQHWWPSAAQPRPDGYIILIDEKGPRIAALAIIKRIPFKRQSFPVCLARWANPSASGAQGEGIRAKRTYRWGIQKHGLTCA